MKRLIFCLPFLVLAFSSSGFSAERPNVIILSVDAMRADHMGYYGYPRNTTPNLDRVMSQGTAFMDASALTPLTNPSIASFFSSLPAYQTGSVRNGVPVRRDLETLPGILRAHGYTTAAVVGCAPLQASRSGLAKDFDHWLDGGTEVLLMLEAGMMTRRALSLIRRGLPEPFFFFIHYPDPHQPHVGMPGFSFRKVPPAGERRSLIEDYYDSELARCDHHAGRILDAMQEKGYLDNALIIVMSDHGEHLGGDEKGGIGHGRKLFQSILRIPFTMTGPGLPAGKELEAPVQMLDFAPTILDYLGLPRGREMQGRSLMPLILDDKPPEPVPFFFESYSVMVMAVLEPVQRFIGKRSPAVITGVRDHDLKLIHVFKNNVWEMFDIRKDPEETNNLFRPDDPESRRMAEILYDWHQKRGRRDQPMILPW